MSKKKSVKRKSVKKAKVSGPSIERKLFERMVTREIKKGIKSRAIQAADTLLDEVLDQAAMKMDRATKSLFYKTLSKQLSRKMPVVVKDFVKKAIVSHKDW